MRKLLILLSIVLLAIAGNAQITPKQFRTWVSTTITTDPPKRDSIWVESVEGIDLLQRGDPEPATDLLQRGMPESDTDLLYRPVIRRKQLRATVIDLFHTDTLEIPKTIHFLKIDGQIYEIKRMIEFEKKAERSNVLDIGHIQLYSFYFDRAINESGQPVIHYVDGHAGELIRYNPKTEQMEWSK